MAIPITKYGGQPVAGWDKRVDIIYILLELTSAAADTATELEFVDWNFTDNSYIASKLRRTFKYKCSADDAQLFFDFSKEPLRCDNGIMTLTNTNCRPIFYIR